MHLEELEDAYSVLDEELLELEGKYNDLLEQHKWVHVILSILLEEQGGVVRISDKTIAGYDLRGKITAGRDPESNEWVIEVHPVESE